MGRSKWLLLALAGLGANACDDVMAPGDPGNLVPKTVVEDLTLPAVELNGSRFHAETFGNPANPVIIFLHGGPGGDYRSLLALAQRYNGYSLADDYFLVYWDQRGTGLSQRHDKSVLNTDQYVADLNALIDRFSPGRKAFLIGESWGGMFATKYINTYPQRVRGAVLIEPGPMKASTMERLKDDIYDFKLGSEVLNDIAWNNQFFSPDDHERLDFERMIGVKDAQPKSHLNMANPEPAWRMGAAVSRYLTEDGQDGKGKFIYDFTTNLSAYATPVLFLAGSLSEILGPSLQTLQVQHFPSATLKVVDGVGHDVQWQKTSEVLNYIRPYLAAR